MKVTADIKPVKNKGANKQGYYIKNKYFNCFAHLAYPF